MKSPLRVVWSEGMLLGPQHLQLQDRFHEASTDARVSTLSPGAWGVAEAAFDTAALAAGQLRLVRFTGVMPDGLVVAFEEGDAGAPPARAIAELFPAAAKSLEVTLAVPRAREGVPTFGETAGPTGSRFLVSTVNATDGSAEGEPVVVPVARPNAVLLVGNEARPDHETLRLGEIVRSPSGQLALDPAALPPLLRIAASPDLMRRVREVLARAIAKQRELVETHRHRDLASGEIAGPDLARLLQLLALNRHIPVLANVAEQGDLSAQAAYLALASLAGELDTFFPDGDPTQYPRFAHDQPRAAFDPVLARLATLLGGLASAQFVQIALEQRPGGIHVARLADDRVLKGGQLFLLVKAELPEAQTAEQVPRLCKIASVSDIQALLGAAAPGLQVQLVHRPPPQLPIRPGALYFSIAKGERYWERIASTRALAVYLPPPVDPARPRLELLAIP